MQRERERERERDDDDDDDDNNDDLMYMTLCNLKQSLNMLISYYYYIL